MPDENVVEDGQRKQNDSESEYSENDSDRQSTQKHGQSKHKKRDKRNEKKRSPNCCQSPTFKKIFGGVFIALNIILAILALMLMVSSMYHMIASRRLAGVRGVRSSASSLVVAVAALIGVGLAIFALVSTLRAKRRHLILFAAMEAILLVVLLAAGLPSVQLNAEDEHALAFSIAESFQEAKNLDPLQVRIWDNTHYSLTCCGVYGPDDFRRFSSSLQMPPDVAVSCCPTYDSYRPAATQESTRIACIAQRLYYTRGCQHEVLLHTHTMGNTIFGQLITYLLFSIIAIIFAIVLAKTYKDFENSRDISKFDRDDDSVNEVRTEK